MWWGTDNKGRFARRPFYKPEELDAECELLLAKFWRSSGKPHDVVIDTEALTVLIEQHVGELNLYADLSADGDGVEGVASFAPMMKPDVAIAESLSTDELRTNRLRTTLAHELGHVHLHDPLYQEKLATGDLFAPAASERLACKRDSMIDAPAVDWMEWQACYFSGALLMPKSAMIALTREQSNGITGAPRAGTTEASNLIEKTIERFEVSAEAARVRLSVLNLLIPAR